MDVILENVSRRFPGHQVLNDFGYHFKTGYSYAITGHNGSGKSTLLQIIAGVQPYNSGSVIYKEKNQEFDPENVYKHLSFVSPYLELTEEFTLSELLTFHAKFKNISGSVDLSFFLKSARLDVALNKPIRFFSSGMKQRTKLVLCAAFENRLLLLDEPTSNLDAQGIEWYLSLLPFFCRPDNTVIIASNIRSEYDFCNEVIDLGHSAVF